MTLQELLTDYPENEVNAYLIYVSGLKQDPKSAWASSISEKKFAHWFKQVKDEGLVLDGKHITIQKTGVTYDYVAYKNKMLIAYPETKIEAALVYKGDTFTCSRSSGSVTYDHTIANPFDQKDEDIVGAFCVVKNSRGEFLTTLSADEIEKHRKVAKTDYIWRAWLKEMTLKTVLKKACKFHFDDVFTSMDDEDNKQNDLDLPVDASLEWKQAIEACHTLGELEAYYTQNSGKGAAFDKLISRRKAEVTQNNGNS
jgi:hypothetical protein